MKRARRIRNHGHAEPGGDDRDRAEAQQHLGRLARLVPSKANATLRYAELRALNRDDATTIHGAGATSSTMSAACIDGEKWPASAKPPKSASAITRPLRIASGAAR